MLSMTDAERSALQTGRIKVPMYYTGVVVDARVIFTLEDGWEVRDSGWTVRACSDSLAGAVRLFRRAWDEKHRKGLRGVVAVDNLRENGK